MILFKESKSRVVSFHAIIMLALFCGSLYLLYTFTGEIDYLQQIRQSMPIFLFLSFGYGSARYQYINADIEIHERYLTGPSISTFIFWHNPPVKINYIELDDDAISCTNIIKGLCNHITQWYSRMGDSRFL